MNLAPHAGALRRSTVLALAVVSMAGIAAAAAEAPAGGKVPITTASEEARQHYLAGRELNEKLRAAEARPHFEQAVAADPSFALAHLGLANTAPSNQAFFDALERAVALAGPATEGERLMILGLDAGVRSEPAKQLEMYSRLVELHPEDERAHNLLAGYYFGVQDYGKAIEEFRQAVAIAPEFSPPYNLMGYAFRLLGDYGGAERAFLKYIELLPEEPNPYDSYAEFLMKIGSFEESITNYEKALANNPAFVPSFIGIGNNQIFLGQPEAARQSFQRLLDGARNDGERRTAHLWKAVSYVHEGQTDEALAEVEAMARIAQASGDLAAVSGDRNLTGDILREAGRLAEAKARYRETVEVMERADVLAEVKEAARRNLAFEEARLALAGGDLAAARIGAAEYRRQAEAKQVPFELRLSRQLEGMIALEDGDAAAALAALEQANDQDPVVLHLTARAWLAKGDRARALELCQRAAEFNALNVNYAFVRDDARAMMRELS